ncbi:hypothetical protein FB45DRAFT_1004625, partial [Roridomyces roridus]
MDDTNEATQQVEQHRLATQPSAMRRAVPVPLDPLRPAMTQKESRPRSDSDEATTPFPPDIHNSAMDVDEPAEIVENPATQVTMAATEQVRREITVLPPLQLPPFSEDPSLQDLGVIEEPELL